jgi:hypothetical protein
MSRLALWVGLGAAVVLSCIDLSGPTWPGTPRHAAFASSASSEAHEAPSIETQPVCIATLGWSAGELGRTVLYRSHREGGRMEVGYFVYWSTERPWGGNLLTYSVVPALVTDAVYSHFLFVLPGAQRALYGPGDVEGVHVTFEEEPDGSWKPVSARAQDGLHEEVALGPDDFVDDRGRLVFMTAVWSHQLGAAGAVRAVREGRAAVSCFEGDAVRPLGDETVRDFRLGSREAPRRARSAWRF